MTRDKWIPKGHVGVDSGRILIADPSYDIPPETLETLSEDYITPWAPYGPCIAVMVSTPGGDGLYPVSAQYDSDGRITAVRIDFTRPG